MKRITGNWLRSNDPKEVVATVWPRLEEFLQSEGLIFSPERGVGIDDGLDSIIDSISNYNDSYLIKSYELDEARNIKEAKKLRKKAKKDILKSRAKFIGRINKFNYNEIGTSWSLGWNPITTKVYIDNIKLDYKDSSGKIVPFYVFHGKGQSSYDLYVGLYSNSKRTDKIREKIRRAADASSLIVDVRNVNPQLGKKIKKEYRKIREELIGENGK